MDKGRKLELFTAQVRLMTDVEMEDDERKTMLALLHGVIDQCNDEAMRKFATKPDGGDA